jgi:hypothetical protein
MSKSYFGIWCAVSLTTASLVISQDVRAQSLRGVAAPTIDACKKEGEAWGKRSFDLADYVAECLAEAKLNCLRSAIAQQVRGVARQAFINRCLSNPE